MFCLKSEQKLKDLICTVYHTYTWEYFTCRRYTQTNIKKPSAKLLFEAELILSVQCTLANISCENGAKV
jgi:hypothetical protein